MLRRFSFLAVALAVAGCAHEQSQPRAAAPAVAAAAVPVSTVDLLTLDGKTTQLKDALGGRPALVSLWATWCDACAGEFEPLGRLSGRAASLGATVVAVAIGEPRAKVAEFVRTHQLDYPQLVDEEFRFADSMGQKRVPATLVIDRDGRVVYSGGVLDDTALTALERVITGRSSASR